MIKFKTIIKKFGQQGEKTGWTYIEVPAGLASKIKPGQKTSFKVKGSIDKYSISQLSLLPMGGGDYILTLNLQIRKKIGKRAGYEVEVLLESDDSPFEFSGDFMSCLNDEPVASLFFKSLPLSHQKYFSKWIESAKTTETKTRRITMAIIALANKKGYAEMLRENKESKQ